jgi:Cytidylate kinase
MIIIITGASHTGKTCLAQKMLEKYKYPYLSVDHLKMGLIRSKNTSLTPCDDKELTDYLWPIVREMIKTAIENKQNLIVEGCYIPSDWNSSFEDEYLSQIRFVGLALTEQYIDAHFTDIIGHGSDIEARLDDSDCTVEWIKAENRSFINEFQPNNNIVLIDDDYEKTIEGLVREEHD